MEPLQDYKAILAGKVYSPKEYLERQLGMSDEEKRQRQRFFTEMFVQHNEQRAEA